jgi:tRNA (adenine22-N1)-methyltransferase
MIKISKRLKEIAGYIEDNINIVDVGCDHALLDIYLMQNRNNIKIIATDILESALNQAKKNIFLYDLKDKINIRLGNGLDVIKKEDNIDTVVIAGMGWMTILNILHHNKNILNNINHLIIQSNSNLPRIREEVSSLGYYIEDEKVVFEKDIFYTIISFKKGASNYSKKELLIGPMLMKKKDSIYIRYLEKELKKNEQLISVIPRSNKAEIANITLYINYIKEELK